MIILALLIGGCALGIASSEMDPKLYMTMRIGKGDDTEYVVQCILYDLNDGTGIYESVGFKEFGGGWDEESVKALYSDYIEYKAQVDEVYSKWYEYVYEEDYLLN